MIFDLHNDLLTSAARYDARYFAVPRRVVLAVWTTDMRPSEPILSALLTAAQTRLTTARSKIAFAVEDSGFLTDEEIPSFMRLPLLYASLTWNDRNRFAGGAKSGDGLTTAGANLIAAMEKAGIVLDTAHLNALASIFSSSLALVFPIAALYCYVSIYGSYLTIPQAHGYLTIETWGLVLCWIFTGIAFLLGIASTLICTLRG
jgi:hypothetical protein